MAERHPLSGVFFYDGGRLRASWRFLLFVLLYLFFLFASNWPLHRASLALSARLPVADPLLVLIVANGVLAVWLSTLLMVKAAEGRGFSFVGFGLARGWGAQLAVGFAAGLALITLIVALEALTGHLRLAVAVSQVRDLSPLLFGFVLFALGALHEELLFRGYGFQRLIEILGPALSTLLVAGVFGAVHLGNPNASWAGAVNTVLVGILFALLYLRSGRLWLPIGVHWGWNFAEAGYGLPVSGITIGTMPLRAEYRGAVLFHGGAYGPEASIFATGAIAVAVVLVFCWKPALRPAVSKEVT